MKKTMPTLLYRLWQVREQLGFADPLSTQELAWVEQCLPQTALGLFKSMSPADQRHSLRVYQGLQARGWTDQDMLTAALLHDVGKAEGRVPFWTRPVIVIARRCSPRLLPRLTTYPIEPQHLARWRRSLSYAWWHAEVGAELAAKAGLTTRAVYYIRMHHRPDSPELVALHLVDEAS